MGAALGVAGAGGGVFWLLALPLPFMLGGMLACLIAGMAGLRLAPPKPVEDPTRATLGVLLGSSFTPALVQEGGGELVFSLALMLPFVALTALVGVPALRWLAKKDLPTAYFSTMPGGLYTMVYLGREAGGDDRFISLMHGTRVLLLVLTLPFLVQVVEQVSLGPRVPSEASLLDYGLADAAVLIFCGVAGVLIAARLRLPAAPLVGPMILSGVVHGAGWSEAKVPLELIYVAQWLLGAMVGSRYSGLKWPALRTILRQAMLLFLIMLAVTGLFAGLLGAGLSRSWIEVMLAFVPGGLAEMSLIALALGYDAAYVSLHHAVRIYLIIALAPLVWRLAGGTFPHRDAGSSREKGQN